MQPGKQRRILFSAIFCSLQCGKEVPGESGYDYASYSHYASSGYAGIVEAGEAFHIHGLIPMKLVNYTQAVVPVILNTWIMSYVERWVKKIIPDMLRTIGVPVLLTAVMIPPRLVCIRPLV